MRNSERCRSGYVGPTRLNLKYARLESRECVFLFNLVGAVPQGFNQIVDLAGEHSSAIFSRLGGFLPLISLSRSKDLIDGSPEQVYADRFLDTDISAGGLGFD